MIERKVTAIANVPESLLEEVKPLISAQGVSISEYLRLCLVHLKETGKPFFVIPEELRGKRSRHGALKATSGNTTFFG